MNIEGYKSFTISKEDPEIAARRILTDHVWTWAGKRRQSFPAIRKIINENGKEAGRQFLKYVIEAGINPPDRLKYFYKYMANQHTVLKEV